MQTIEPKTKSCARCGGTGFKGGPVVHLGIPGLCYDCNGSGKLQWQTGEVVRAINEKNKHGHLREIEEKAAWVKEDKTKKEERLAGRLAKGGDGTEAVRILRVLIERKEEELQELRETWRRVNNWDKGQFKGRWIAG